jgi:hypothetical protein
MKEERLLKQEMTMLNTLNLAAYYATYSLAGCAVTYLVYLHSNGFWF